MFDCCFRIYLFGLCLFSLYNRVLCLLSWLVAVVVDFLDLLLFFFDYLCVFFFFSSRRRHTRSYGDWSSDVCSSDLIWLTWTSSPKSSPTRKSASSSPSRRLETSSVIWETASMMPRRSMPPMLVFPLRAPSMLPKRRLISSYSKRIWVSLCRACVKDGRPSRTRSSMSSWPPAPISATCSAWPEYRSTCRFSHCCPSRSCSPT